MSLLMKETWPVMIRSAVCCLMVALAAPLSLCAQSYTELVERAFAQAEADSLAEAEVSFKEALRLEPSQAYNAIIFARLGIIQQRLHRPGEALESFNYALSLAPRSVHTLLGRAALYMEMGKNDAAYNDYCDVIDLDSDNRDALLLRAYLSMKKREYQAARADYNALIKLEPGNYNALLGMALLNQKERRYQEALSNYALLLEQYPDDVSLYVARAELEQEMGSCDMALMDMDEAVRLSPSVGEYYTIRATILLKLNKKSLAKTELDKAAGAGISRSSLRELYKQCK